MFQPFDLTGQVCLVTGGARGIGYGMAFALSAAGADVELWSLSADGASAAAERIRAGTGGRVTGLAVDVSNEQQVVDAMARAVERHGRIDTVIANAGISRLPSRFVDTSADMLRELIATNLEGAFFTLREGCRHMVDRFERGQPGGSLVAVSSYVARHGSPRTQPYAATKGALLSLVRGMAIEHAPMGIRANAILPGIVETDILRAAQAAGKAGQDRMAQIPVKRWGQPEDFGGIAVYLASSASSYHTGDQFVIDGGLSS